MSGLSDAEWREFQNIPDQGYSHRAWLDNVIAQREAAAVKAALDSAADDLYAVYARASKGPDVDAWTDGWAEGYLAAAFRLRNHRLRTNRSEGGRA